MYTLRDSFLSVPAPPLAAYTRARPREQDGKEEARWRDLSLVTRITHTHTHIQTRTIGTHDRHALAMMRESRKVDRTVTGLPKATCDVFVSLRSSERVSVRVRLEKERESAAATLSSGQLRTRYNTAVLLAVWRRRSFSLSHSTSLSRSCIIRARK